jgi:hypothetical protein
MLFLTAIIFVVVVNNRIPKVDSSNEVIWATVVVCLPDINPKHILVVIKLPF